VTQASTVKPDQPDCRVEIRITQWPVMAVHDDWSIERLDFAKLIAVWKPHMASTLSSRSQTNRINKLRPGFPVLFSSLNSEGYERRSTN
jgi:hypothetical protein